MMENVVGKIVFGDFNHREWVDKTVRTVNENTANIVSTFYRRLMDCRETELKRTLIELGWTPPPDDIAACAMKEEMDLRISPPETRSRGERNEPQRYKNKKVRANTGADR